MEEGGRVESQRDLCASDAGADHDTVEIDVRGRDNAAGGSSGGGGGGGGGLSLVEDIAEEVQAAIDERRSRLNSRLTSSLRTFRDEVLDEVETQADQARQRKDKYSRRREEILDSLGELREDILSDIEVTISGVVAGGRRVERGLRELRSEWEEEVDALIADARADVELAVRDVEDAIEAQRSEVRRATETFNAQWIGQGRGEGRRGGGANVTAFNLTAWAARGGGGGLAKYLAETQDNIRSIEEDLEADLSDFKARWAVTAARLEYLPQELPKLRTLASVRAYVADTIFEGGTLPLVRRARRRASSPSGESDQPTKAPAKDYAKLKDPLGVRLAAAQGDVLRPTPDSDLRSGGRRLAILTTAALPWMTGTAVNPLLRAAYLAAKGYPVTLYVPWLPKQDQLLLFPRGLAFDKPAQQEAYSRWWLSNRANVEPPPSLRIRWYPANYEPGIGGIIQSGKIDLAALVPPEERDVAILEEPEHLNWYHHGSRWPELYRHVVGVAHTNYLQYSRLQYPGLEGQLKESWMELLNAVVCAAYTDVVVKLSPTLVDVPGHNLVCNVHGVRGEFLAVGAQAARNAGSFFDRGAYFLGKALWTKGYRELLDALAAHGPAGGDAPLPPLHTFGSGPDENAIRSEVERLGVDVVTHEGIDHAHPSMHGYSLFVNPSTSDVLCTATAEALAMGKKVLIPDHPSNLFFKQFSNAILYDDPAQLGSLISEALATPPAAMTKMEQYALSWEAATERLLDAAALPAGTRRPKERPLHSLAYGVHYTMGTQPLCDVLRVASGVRPVFSVEERLRAAVGLATGDRGDSDGEKGVVEVGSSGGGGGGGGGSSSSVGETFGGESGRSRGEQQPSADGSTDGANRWRAR